MGSPLLFQPVAPRHPFKIEFMKRFSWAYVKWSLLGVLGLLLLVILSINLAATKDLPELVRVQIERYAVCSYWAFGWHLASTGVFALFFFLLGAVLGALGVLFLLRR